MKRVSGSAARHSFILETKLSPPRVRDTVLRRERLLDLLRDNKGKKLILLCADAGYGKTTLLAHFCEELTVPFVYYDLDDTDSNMATFFSYLAAGVRRHDMHFGRIVEELVQHTGNIDIVVGTFINEFVRSTIGELYIILDDFHYLQNNRKICSAIDYFLRHMPANLHFIISSRAVPNINLAYYAAKGELLKIEKDYLRFSPVEIHALLTTVHGLKVSDEDVKRIAEFSAGWVTLLQLMLQKIRATGEGTTQDALNSCVASDENVFNYFAGEVFDQTPRAVKEFLLKTAVLDYFNPKVCDELLCIRRSRKIIARLDAENMFISKVGENYQYHPVFHEFLHRMLGQYFTGGIVKKLHEKAGMHFVKQGEYTSAVRHLVAAGQYAKAARILEKNHQHWARRADYSNYVQLVDSIPAAIHEKHPYLLLRKADALDVLDRKTQALRLAESAARLFRQQTDRPGAAEAMMAKALIYYEQGQRRKGIFHAKKAYDLLEHKNSTLGARMLMQLGSMYRDACRFDRAQECFESALKILGRHQDRELEESLLTRIGLLHLTMSNFKEADRMFMDVLSRFEDLAHGLNLIYKYSTVVAINIDAGDYGKAWEYLKRAESMLQKYNDPWITKYLVYMRGKLFWAEGHFPEAIQYLEKAIGEYKTFSRMLDPYIIGDIVDSHLRLGEVSRAREAFTKLDGVRDIIDETPNLTVAYLTIQGSLLSAEGKFPEALASLYEALKRVRSVDRYYMTMTTCGELSKCLYRSGAHEQALSRFLKCLEIARLREYEAYMIIEARDCIDLFRLAVERGCLIDYIAGILERTGSEPAKSLLNQLQIRRGICDLKCRLLGRFELSDAGGRVLTPAWRTRTAKELFILFVAGPANKYSKDQLIDAFWPDKDLRYAAHHLHVEISALRSTLKNIVGSSLDRQELILFDGHHYRLNPQILVGTDVQEFERLISEAASELGSDRARAEQLYTKALSLYRGDFVEGDVAPWCSEIRSRYRGELLKILKCLGAMCLENSAFEEGLGFLRRALELENTDESVHIAIMRCLHAMNDRSGLQKQYERLVKTLKRLGVSSPPREATRMYQDSLR
ncbi:tetratricopeptide repeat protein [candidate division WOR-3 bacterium]|nr:tetratricopeptide repeat protein [candidate division WOR-3 bacterium]